MTETPIPPSSRWRFQTATILAVAADALQTLVLPLFAEGALSPADDLLDLGVQPNWCVCWVGTGSSYPAFAAGGVNLPTAAESTGLEKLSIADHRCMRAGQFTDGRCIRLGCSGCDEKSFSARINCAPVERRHPQRVVLDHVFQ